jgi:hypothetical protein
VPTSRKATSRPRSAHRQHFYRLGQPASPSEIKSALQRIPAASPALETFERTQRHLADNGVDVAATTLTLGAALRLDARNESFAGHAAANALLARQYRAPFTLPSAAQLSSQPKPTHS